MDIVRLGVGVLAVFGASMVSISGQRRHVSAFRMAIASVVIA